MYWDRERDVHRRKKNRNVEFFVITMSHIAKENKFVTVGDTKLNVIISICIVFLSDRCSLQSCLTDQRFNGEDEREIIPQ